MTPFTCPREEALIADYDRARRALGEFRHTLLGCMMTVVYLDPAGLRRHPWVPTTFENEELLEKRCLLLAYLESEDLVHEHLVEFGEIETDAGLWKIGYDGRPVFRRYDAPSEYSLAMRGPKWN